MISLNDIPTIILKNLKQERIKITFWLMRICWIFLDRSFWPCPFKANRMGGPWHSRWYVYEEIKQILKACLHIPWHCLSPLEGKSTSDQKSLPLKIQLTILYSHKWSFTALLVTSNTLNENYVTWPWWFRRVNHYERFSEFTRGKQLQFIMGNITFTFFKSCIWAQWGTFFPLHI